MLSALEDGAHRTTAIVKSLRLFSKQDADILTEYDIIGGLESTLILLSSKLKDRILLKRDYEVEQLLIPCFPGQLNQVFMNILTNAIEAIDGTGTIGLQVMTLEKSVVISISDSGSGIDASIINKIMDPFYSTKGPKDGTGLGLSISQTIIHEHNGEILFSANSPTGTIVTISLPSTSITV